MPAIVEPPLPEPRYTYGGDEFIFCEIAEGMSFGANFKALAICQELGRRNVDGVVEICPANASYLVRLNPDVVEPAALLAQLKEIEGSLDTAHVSFSTRVIDVPAYYDDPWTREVLMRFRDHHQAPEGIATSNNRVCSAECQGLVLEDALHQRQGGVDAPRSEPDLVRGGRRCGDLLR